MPDTFESSGDDNMMMKPSATNDSASLNEVLAQTFDEKNSDHRVCFSVPSSSSLCHENAAKNAETQPLPELTDFSYKQVETRIAHLQEQTLDMMKMVDRGSSDRDAGDEAANTAATPPPSPPPLVAAVMMGENHLYYTTEIALAALPATTTTVVGIDCDWKLDDVCAVLGFTKASILFVDDYVANRLLLQFNNLEPSLILSSRQPLLTVALVSSELYSSSSSSSSASASSLLVERLNEKFVTATEKKDDGVSSSLLLKCVLIPPLERNSEGSTVPKKLLSPSHHHRTCPDETAAAAAAAAEGSIIVLSSGTSGGPPKGFRIPMSKWLVRLRELEPKSRDSNYDHHRGDDDQSEEKTAAVAASVSARTLSLFSPAWATDKTSVWRTLLFERGGSVGFIPRAHRMSPWRFFAAVRPTFHVVLVPVLLSALQSEYENELAKRLSSISSCCSSSSSSSSRAQLVARAHAEAAMFVYEQCLGGRVRVVYSGGAAVPIEVLRKLGRLFHGTCKFIHLFGTSETGYIGRGAVSGEEALLVEPNVRIRIRSRNYDDHDDDDHDENENENEDGGMLESDRAPSTEFLMNSPPTRGELEVCRATAVQPHEWMCCDDAQMNSILDRYSSGSSSRVVDQKNDEHNEQWSCTGDIVEILSSSSSSSSRVFFKLIGRASSLQKLPGGLFFSPEQVETTVASLLLGNYFGAFIVTVHRDRVVLFCEGKASRDGEPFSEKEAQDILRKVRELARAGANIPPSQLPSRLIQDVHRSSSRHHAGGGGGGGDNDDGASSSPSSSSSQWHSSGCFTGSGKLIRGRVMERLLSLPPSSFVVTDYFSGGSTTTSATRHDDDDSPMARRRAAILGEVKSVVGLDLDVQPQQPIMTNDESGKKKSNSSSSSKTLAQLGCDSLSIFKLLAWIRRRAVVAAPQQRGGSGGVDAGSSSGSSSPTNKLMRMTTVELSKYPLSALLDLLEEDDDKHRVISSSCDGDVPLAEGTGLIMAREDSLVSQPSQGLFDGSSPLGNDGDGDDDPDASLRVLREAQVAAARTAVFDYAKRVLLVSKKEDDKTLLARDDGGNLSPNASAAPPSATTTTAVFLTGATGYLGSSILSEFLTLFERQSSSSKKMSYHITCLVRADTDELAAQRLLKSFSSWGHDGQALRKSLEKKCSSTVHCDVVAGDVSVRHFGLSRENFHKLAAELRASSSSTIINVAAAIKMVPLEVGLDLLLPTNTLGAIHVAELAQAVSSCIVAPAAAAAASSQKRTTTKLIHVSSLSVEAPLDVMKDDAYVVTKRLADDVLTTHQQQQQQQRQHSHSSSSCANRGVMFDLHIFRPALIFAADDGGGGAVKSAAVEEEEEEQESDNSTTPTKPVAVVVNKDDWFWRLFFTVKALGGLIPDATVLDAQLQYSTVDAVARSVVHLVGDDEQQQQGCCSNGIFVHRHAHDVATIRSDVLLSSSSSEQQFSIVPVFAFAAAVKAFSQISQKETGESLPFLPLLAGLKPKTAGIDSPIAAAAAAASRPAQSKFSLIFSKAWSQIQV